MQRGNESALSVRVNHHLKQFRFCSDRILNSFFLSSDFDLNSPNFRLESELCLNYFFPFKIWKFRQSSDPILNSIWIIIGAAYLSQIIWMNIRVGSWNLKQIFGKTYIKNSPTKKKPENFQFQKSLKSKSIHLKAIWVKIIVIFLWYRGVAHHSVTVGFGLNHIRVWRLVLS